MPGARDSLEKMERKSLAGWIPILLVLVGFGAYAADFILQTSFVIDGERYFSLFDDPMVSMRYAANLANGDGLVWNPGGERVEGFSNPLWVGTMALVHMLPLPLSKTSLVIQVLCAVLLVANLVVVGMLSRHLSNDSNLVEFVAVVLTAFYYPLNNWALLGNDVAPAILLMSLVVWLVVRQVDHGHVGGWIYVLMSVGTWVRLDLVVLYMVVWLYLIVVDGKRRRFHLLFGGAVLVGSMGIQTALRYGYYGDVLPNPYYLKLTGGPMGLRLAHGASALLDFLWSFNWVVFASPLLMFAFARDRKALLLIAVVLAVVGYSVYVGADAWEHRGGANRFLASAMGLFFVLLASALERLRRAVLHRARWKTTSATRVSHLAVLLAAAAVLVNSNASLGLGSLRAALLRERPIYAIGNERNVSIGLFLRSITDEEATIAYVAAGAAPYFAGRQAVDLLGKTDLHVARVQMRISSTAPLEGYRPGHMKRDYAYSIGQLRPDVVVETWPGTRDEFAPFLPEYLEIRNPALERFLPDGRMYLRRDSEHIQWDLVQAFIYDSESEG